MTSFQPDPEAITWKMHFASAPGAVFEALTTDRGREAFWVERSAQDADRVHMEFPGGFATTARVTEEKPVRRWQIEYFGATVTFDLERADGGTDLRLTTSGFAPGDREELLAGWLNVLFPMKASVDHRVDLRNHDPERTWWHGFADG